MKLRLWNEIGDFLAGIVIHENSDGTAWVEIDPFRYDECPDNPDFPYVGMAMGYALREIERFKAQAIAECDCGTDGTTGECGVLEPHGISVQTIP